MPFVDFFEEEEEEAAAAAAFIQNHTHTRGAIRNERSGGASGRCARAYRTTATSTATASCLPRAACPHAARL